jgi:hypothetical protein
MRVAAADAGDQGQLAALYFRTINDREAVFTHKLFLDDLCFTDGAELLGDLDVKLRPQLAHIIQICP